MQVVNTGSGPIVQWFIPGRGRGRKAWGLPAQVAAEVAKDPTRERCPAGWRGGGSAIGAGASSLPSFISTNMENEGWG